MAPVLTAEQAAFIQGGVSLSAASRDGSFRTSIARVLGCRVSADRLALTVLLSASRSADFLADLCEQRPITVVCSLPTTHETLQIKGVSAHIETAQAGDAGIVAAHTEAFAAQIMPIGFTAPFVGALLDCDPGDLVGVRFAPSSVYTQTPGPRAGQRINAP